MARLTNPSSVTDSALNWLKLLVLMIFLAAIFGVITVGEAGHYLATLAGAVIHAIAVVAQVVKDAVGEVRASR